MGEPQMSLTGYAEEFYLPRAKLDDAGEIVKQPKASLLRRIYTFCDEWTQHSYEAWMKAGQPGDF